MRAAFEKRRAFRLSKKPFRVRITERKIVLTFVSIGFAGEE